jgi:hypothetical protein
MKRLLILGLTAALATSALADRGHSRGHSGRGHFGVAIGSPIFFGGPAYYSPPVYYSDPYYNCPPPYAYYGPPAPFVSFSLGFGGGGHSFRHRHFR